MVRFGSYAQYSYSTSTGDNTVIWYHRLDLVMEPGTE